MMNTQLQSITMAEKLQLKILTAWVYVVLVEVVCISATSPWALRSVTEVSSQSDVNVSLPTGFKTYYYTQTLDHFGYKPESYETFQHKYVVDWDYWGGNNGCYPIFVYTGDEQPIDLDVSATGFLHDLARQFMALLVYIEHRYYGESMPFGDNSYQDANTLGYFTSTQALADYAEVITNLKLNLSAQCSPVVAFGGSYGGMLASWFRLKYPHIVIGALASSAPILYFEDITPHDGYGVVITNNFKENSESCYNTIKDSWSEINRVAAEENGLTKLSQIFNTCTPLNSSEEIKDWLSSIYMSAAQYDNPPKDRIGTVCNSIDGAPPGTDILGRISRVLNTSSAANSSCNNLYELKPSNHSGWGWQTCTEMVMPIGWEANQTMFEASPFDIKTYTNNCRQLFGIEPRPHWITTEFGGHDIKSVLGNFASNIIFSNGLRDPYSSAGVLEDISNTVVAIHTEKGAHCLDLQVPYSSDPDWLVAVREKEVSIIESWITGYGAKYSRKLLAKKPVRK